MQNLLSLYSWTKIITLLIGNVMAIYVRLCQWYHVNISHWQSPYRDVDMRVDKSQNRLETSYLYFHIYVMVVLAAGCMTMSILPNIDSCLNNGLVFHMLLILFYKGETQHLGSIVEKEFHAIFHFLFPANKTKEAPRRTGLLVTKAASSMRLISSPGFNDFSVLTDLAVNVASTSYNCTGGKCTPTSNGMTYVSKQISFQQM